MHHCQLQAVNVHTARHIQPDRLIALVRCLPVCTAAYGPKEHIQPDTYSQYRLMASMRSACPVTPRHLPDSQAAYFKGDLL
jgi:hypothetical protein